MSFFVAGKPVPQGAISFSHGRGYHQNDKALRAWREVVAWSVRQHFKEPLQGEVTLTVKFILAKPKSAKRNAPTVRPDLDHLVRAIGDALTGIAFRDDSQVTTLIASKRYVGVMHGIIEGVAIEVVDVPDAD